MSVIAWLVLSAALLGAIGFVVAAVVGLPALAASVPSLLVGAVTLFAAWGWGCLVVRFLPGQGRDSADDLAGLPTLLLGFGVLEAAMLVAGLGGIITRASSLVILAGGAGLAVARVVHAPPSWRLPRCAWLAILPWCASGSIALAAFLGSLPPPSWFDALEYHLVIPATYVLEGRMVEMPDNFFSHLPHGLELIDALMLAIDHSYELAPFHWAIGIIAALAVARLARRQAHRAAGPLAAAIFLTYDKTGLSLALVSVDLALAACMTVAVDLVLSAREDHDLALPGCLIAGLGASFKIHGAVHIAGFVAGIWLLERFDVLPRLAIRRRLLHVVALGLPLAPWAFLNWVRHHNPAYPFAAELFAGPAEDSAWVAWIASYTREMGITGGTLAALPRECLRRLFEPEDWNPLPLAALALLLLRPRSANRIALAFLVALSWLTWVVTAPVARYAVVPVALTAALAAGTLLTLVTRARPRAVRAVVVAAYTLVLVTSAWHHTAEILRARDPFPWLIGTESSAGFALRSVEDSPAEIFRRANATLAADARVLSLEEPRMYGLWRRFTAATVFDRRTLWRFRDDHATAAVVAARMRAAGYTHLLVDSGFTERALTKIHSSFGYGEADAALIGEILARHTHLAIATEHHRLYALSPEP